jgi:probable HAF family extracellular repeat protein
VASGETHAFVWTATSGMVDLGGLMGGGSSVAGAINEDGVIVGYGDDSDGQSHGLMFVPK